MQIIETGFDRLRPYPVVDDLLEVNTDGARVTALVTITAVNEHADLLRPDLIRTISKYKQHRVDDV